MLALGLAFLMDRTAVRLTNASQASLPDGGTQRPAYFISRGAFTTALQLGKMRAVLKELGLPAPPKWRYALAHCCTLSATVAPASPAQTRFGLP